MLAVFDPFRIAAMCNVPSGAEAYAKLYESVSSDGVNLTLMPIA